MRGRPIGVIMWNSFTPDFLYLDSQRTKQPEKQRRSDIRRISRRRRSRFYSRSSHTSSIQNVQGIFVAHWPITNKGNKGNSGFPHDLETQVPRKMTGNSCKICKDEQADLGYLTFWFLTRGWNTERKHPLTFWKKPKREFLGWGTVKKVYFHIKPFRFTSFDKQNLEEKENLPGNSLKKMVKS